MNTGDALYAMPLSSIIDLGVNLKIKVAKELSREIEPPSRGISIEPPSRGINIEPPSRGIDIEPPSSWIDMGIDAGSAWIGMSKFALTLVLCNHELNIG